MNYPVYSGYPNRGTDIVDAYIQTIGAHEPDNRPAIESLGSFDITHASLCIGRGCLILVDGNDRAADRLLRRVKRDLESHVQAETPDRGMLGTTALELYNLATMLQDRNNPAAPQRLQQQNHRATLNELTYFTGQHLGPTVRRARAGRDAQQRALGLLGRYAHPWLTVIPALPHHDDSLYHRSNYDALVIESGPEENTRPTVHKIQIKRPCLGFCGDPTGQAEGNKQRAAYAQDITLLSDHCDMQTRQRRLGMRRNGIGPVLKKEFDGEATEEDLRALDIITDGVTLDITAPASYRRGRKAICPAPVYTPRQSITYMSPVVTTARRPANSPGRLKRAS